MSENTCKDFSIFIVIFASLVLPVYVYKPKQNSHHYLAALFDFVMWIEAPCVSMKQFAPILSVDANDLVEVCKNRGSCMKYVL